MLYNKSIKIIILIRKRVVMYVRIHIQKLLKRRECLIKSIFNPTSTNRLNKIGFYCYGVLFFISHYMIYQHPI